MKRKILVTLVVLPGGKAAPSPYKWAYGKRTHQDKIKWGVGWQR